MKLFIEEERRLVSQKERNNMFSQRDEEKYILRFFKKKHGRFLDIGAYDGKTFSTTRQLALNGWEGVMIEPSPSVFPALEKRYFHNPKVHCIKIAVGRRDGDKEFYDSRGDAVSSFDKAHVELWKTKGNVKFKKVVVEVVTIPTLFQQLGYHFDFINIDTEGYSWYILERLPYDKLIQLKMICVEFDGRAEKVEKFLNDMGFIKIHQTAENIIAVKK